MKNYQGVFLLMVAIQLGCSHGAKTPRDPDVVPHVRSASIESKQVAAQEGSSNVTEIRFQEGSAEVLEGEIKTINHAIEKIEKNEALTSITIAVWGDSKTAYQTDKGENELDISLAEARGRNLLKEINQDRPNLEVKLVNMAKHPGKIKVFFRTKEFRIHEAFELAGSSVKPSEAVVIFNGSASD